MGSFPPPPSQLSGRILFASPRGTSILLHNDLLCNGTCSVTGGAYRTGGGGGRNGNDPRDAKPEFGNDFAESLKLFKARLQV